MKVLIIANGKINDVGYVKSLLPEGAYVICADGGVKYAQAMGVIPDLIVGDLDSSAQHLITEYAQQGVMIQRHPRDKDRTDTHIAVDIAIEMGAEEVVITGALGGRWDHSYANLMLLLRLAKKNVKAQLIDDQNIVWLTNASIDINGQKGEIISLLPFIEDTVIASTKGLKYSLFNKILPLDFPFGISNVFISTVANINVSKGWLMIVKSRDLI